MNQETFDCLKERMTRKIISLLSLFNNVNIVTVTDSKSPSLLYFDYHEHRLLIFLTFFQKSEQGFYENELRVKFKTGWLTQKDSFEFFPIAEIFSVEDKIESNMQTILEQIFTSSEEWISNYKKELKDKELKNKRNEEVISRLKRIHFDWNYFNEEMVVSLPLDGLSDELLTLLENEFDKK